MPEREDERLTTPSHGLDLSKLLHGAPPDPDRAERIHHKRANVAAKSAHEREVRMDHLHTLYMRARNFIVTPQQLDAAVDAAFGTPEQPVDFSSAGQAKGTSMWAKGRPDGLQDMLAAASGEGGRGALQRAERVSGDRVQRERMKRLAERLTGGEMD